MECAKCGTANAEGVQFCTNCHATLIFKCPKCDHRQPHGGKCDACGQDFAAFWSTYLAMKGQETQQIARDKTMAEMNAVASVVTLPLAAAPNLSRFLIVQLFGRLFRRLLGGFSSR